MVIPLGVSWSTYLFSCLLYVFIPFFFAALLSSFIPPWSKYSHRWTSALNRLLLRFIREPFCCFCSARSFVLPFDTSIFSISHRPIESPFTQRGRIRHSIVDSKPYPQSTCTSQPYFGRSCRWVYHPRAENRRINKATPCCLFSIVYLPLRLSPPHHTASQEALAPSTNVSRNWTYIPFFIHSISPQILLEVEYATSCLSVALTTVCLSLQQLRVGRRLRDSLRCHLRRLRGRAKTASQEERQGNWSDF